MGQRNTTTCIPQDLQPLIGGFLMRRLQDIAGLEHSLETGDLNSAKGIAHKLKGNGVGFGFPAISQIGAEIELAATHGEAEVVRDLVEEFRKLIHHYQSQHFS
jgi:HPt (histidine-containing phosphotransfer) domain-containing protein